MKRWTLCGLSMTVAPLAVYCIIVSFAEAWDSPLPKIALVAATGIAFVAIGFCPTERANKVVGAPIYFLLFLFPLLAAWTNERFYR